MEEKVVAKFVLNPDEEHVKKIREAIERKREKYGEGYCPCVLPKNHNEDTICNCKEYLTTGKCHCGLYIE